MNEQEKIVACINCRWCIDLHGHEGINNLKVCSHECGKIYTYLDGTVKMLFVDICRSNEYRCGHEGKYYEQKEDRI